MKRTILVSALFTAVFSLASAQQGDLNRQMDVTRAYEPTVSTARKVDIKPNMIDTVDLRPELDYGITPNPLSGGFDVRPINAAKVSIDMAQRSKPFYAKLMAGFPLQSLADIYATATRDRGYFGAYVNHYGSWSKIVNGNDIKTPASSTFNKIGAVGEHRFGRYSVSGELGYDYDMVSRYGYFVEPGASNMLDTSASGLRQNFSTIRGKVVFGNAFRDLSYFNFRVGLSGSYFNDKFDAAESNINGFVDLGKRFGGAHDVTLHLGYEGFKGAKNLRYSDNIFTIAPLYRYAGEKFTLAAGGDYTLNTSPDGDAKHYFFPRLELRLDVANGYFVPYAEVNGGLRSNNYASIAALNPYVESGLVMPNAAEYHARAGITGSISSAFSYKVFVGYSWYKGLTMFANYFSPEHYGNTFMGIMDGAGMFTVGGDLEGRISGAFSVQAAVQYSAYNMDNLDKPIGIPDFTGRLGLKYTHGDKFNITAGAKFIGSRYFYDFDGLATDFGALEYNKQKAVVDVYLGAEVRLIKGLDLVLSGNNLLGSKLFPYSRYAGLGANAMAGVKIVF